MYLIFDSETSNLPQKGIDLDHPCQARILQLSAILLDDELKEVGNCSTLIKVPEGTQIHPQAFSKHGLTVEKCRKYGVTIEYALQLFLDLLKNAEMIIGFNVEFDKKMLDMESYRLFENPIAWINNEIPLREACMMKHSTPFVKLSFPNGKNMFGQKYKWPKLEEAYAYFFHKLIEGQHDASIDCKATKDIFVHLVEIESIEF